MLILFLTEEFYLAKEKKQGIIYVSLRVQFILCVMTCCDYYLGLTCLYC